MALLSTSFHASHLKSVLSASLSLTAPYHISDKFCQLALRSQFSFHPFPHLPCHPNSHHLQLLLVLLPSYSCLHIQPVTMIQPCLPLQPHFMHLFSLAHYNFITGLFIPQMRLSLNVFAFFSSLWLSCKPTLSLSPLVTNSYSFFRLQLKLFLWHPSLISQNVKNAWHTLTIPCNFSS